MRYQDYLRFASQQLTQRKGRTALTTIGVTVGVFALTTIVSVANGLEDAIVQQLTDDETQTRILITPGVGVRPEEPEDIVGVDDPAKVDRLRKASAKRRRTERGGPGVRRVARMTTEAMAEVAAMDHVIRVRPLVMDSFDVHLGEHEYKAVSSYGVVGSDPRWDVRVIAGQPFEDDAEGVWLHEYLLYKWGYPNDADQAALIGQTVTLERNQDDQLGAGLDMARDMGVEVPDLDDEQAKRMARLLAARMGIELDDQGQLPAIELPLLGVVRERIEEDGFEVWEDSFSLRADVFLPQAKAEQLFMQVPNNRRSGFRAVTVDVDEIEHLKPTEQAIKDEGYNTVSITTILERVGQVLAVLTVFVSGLTAIALLVAVLGITNTMIMSVSERTREIGVLKALGATDAQVRNLFLMESGLIGFLGGITGVGSALLVSIPGDWANREIIKRTTEYTWDGSVFSFPPWLLGIAMAFAVLISVLAAWIPARRASRVDPVIALRDE
jgi:putative ABC transport system permease protein